MKLTRDAARKTKVPTVIPMIAVVPMVVVVLMVVEFVVRGIDAAVTDEDVVGVGISGIPPEWLGSVLRSVSVVAAREGMVMASPVGVSANWVSRGLWVSKCENEREGMSEGEKKKRKSQGLALQVEGKGHEKRCEWERTGSVMMERLSHKHG